MMKIIIKEKFKDDWITRQAGEILRKMIVQELAQGNQLELDFTGLTVASTSFFDEGIAKLVLEGYSSDQIKKMILWTGLHPQDAKLVKLLSKKRGLELGF